MFTAFYGFWDYWELFHKVTFDGIRKIITVNSGISDISVKTDLYSSWKEWVMVDNNSKYPSAFRVTGGDPLGGGAFTGDVYFLTNGWRILLDHSINFDGVIYTDETDSPFVVADGVYLSTNKVSALVSVVTTESIGGITVPTVEDIRQEMDTNSSKLTQIQSTASATQTTVGNIQTSVNNVPDVFEIAAQVKTSLVPELAHLMALQNGAGLDSTQATMLLELYRIMGLDPTKPLVVTTTSRSAGSEITQAISTNSTSTTVTRD